MPQRDGPRLDGRNGEVWRLYVLGRTQAFIAEEFGVSQQRVSQILAEVRAAIPEDARKDAALLDLERLDVLLVGVMPAAAAGDAAAARAVLAILERRAKMLKLDLEEPLRISFARHLDDQGELLADTIGAVLDALDLSHDQRMHGLATAQAKLAGEPLPPASASAAAPVEESVEDAERAKREAEFRRLMAADGVDADALLADDEDDQDEGDADV